MQVGEEGRSALQLPQRAQRPQQIPPLDNLHHLTGLSQIYRERQRQTEGYRSLSHIKKFMIYRFYSVPNQYFHTHVSHVFFSSTYFWVQRLEIQGIQANLHSSTPVFHSQNNEYLRCKINENVEHARRSNQPFLYANLLLKENLYLVSQKSLLDK